MTKSSLKPRCLCIDIETAREDSTLLREVGAFRPDTDARLKLSGKSPKLIAELDAITQGAGFLLGHNITVFDQPALAVLHPQLKLHELPLVDTLELSPIAFPQNPYHRLVKDYKLCTTTRNDPVRDAELAYELFLDIGETLKQRVNESPEEMLCFHYLLAAEDGSGIANLFATLRRSLRPSLQDAQAAWLKVSHGKVCQQAQRKVAETYFPDAEWAKALAYVLAWLRVAGGNSVLPQWVNRTFPQTRELIGMLRDSPCGQADCLWCREQHDLAHVLPCYFPGITSFRSKPALPDGSSLQQTIVENGFAGIPMLAILPTGGGKSLCFQLPALAKYYRNGGLTVVISPLQSLMKDQVDNLEARGITCAGYLNSLLNPLERSLMLEKLRLGDLGLVFVAPEQFRSIAFTRALEQRDIAGWVFDEAHCLSKWGHDFRPDYLYVSRFIRKHQQDRLSPVYCFTATAKPDVVDDICEHFQRHLSIDLERLEGGVARENLCYEVREVPIQSKYPETLKLLEDALAEEGGAIVFCARQKSVEELADFLNAAGLDCGYFHGGMTPENKRAVQEAFLNGGLRVIAATNAFGMGVDKPDVRLVIHLDTPGSLENYLQEAGRAGRDQEPAQCILLYDEKDLDVQFRLLKNSRLSYSDIHAILKALRNIQRKDRGEGGVVVTSGEILLEVPDTPRIDPDGSDADTKVRIAVAWLEEARLLERQENHTNVFPGSLLVASLDEAKAILDKKLGTDTNMQPYLQIVQSLLLADDDEGISTDHLMVVTGLESSTVQKMLRELDDLRIVSNDMEIGITLYKDPETVERLQALCLLENALVAKLRELAPDADDEGWVMMNVRMLCDALRRDTQQELTPERLTRLMKSFAEAFGDGVGNKPFFALKPANLDSRRVKVLRPWHEIDVIRERRMRFAEALLNAFLAARKNSSLLITCKQGELESALKSDLAIQDLKVKDWFIALASTLSYLDANEVLHLAKGKAIFRSAMNIELNPDARRRQFRKSDYAELALHYKDKTIQVHVMAEYARLAMGKIQAAMAFIVDYFDMERDDFVTRYFAGRKDVLDMATTEASHRRVLTSLRNPEQQAIVAAYQEGNHLVLAGPGSGKTRVIVHRTAWLLRECMVLPAEIMVLAYNRSAALEIKRRLWALVGEDAAGVVVQTIHGLAMRLTGTSFAVAAERGENIDFDTVIRRASALLLQAEEGNEEGASLHRDRMLAGLRYVLVDEYQDINADHYALISAVAGRKLNSSEDRLFITVVGDDDQNIYAFGGASVQFIRQFETDYEAKRFHLVENYRSTRHIIDSANGMIEGIRDRMKPDHRIRIDHNRSDEPAGGELATLDSVTQGRVHILEVDSDLQQEVTVIVQELTRLRNLTSDKQSWGNFAVIARHWDTLEPLHALCRQHGIPARLMREGDLPHLYSAREGHHLLALLQGQYRRSGRPHLVLGKSTLSRWFRRYYQADVQSEFTQPFIAALASFIREMEDSAPGMSERVGSEIIEALYEFRSGEDSSTNEVTHGPVRLLTAHRAKGLEFDHVLILDGGGWGTNRNDERRLFYVAMTRARKSLSIAHRHRGRHAFVHDAAALALRTRPDIQAGMAQLHYRVFRCTPEHIVLSWPGYFASTAPVHRAIKKLSYGDFLSLRPCPDGKEGWELADSQGVAVGRMSQKFSPPPGEILAVKVAAVLVRQAKDEEGLRCSQWELVLPEIEWSADKEPEPPR